ncbi:MAG: DUF5131 family protein, partial [Pseudomonadota bacterium]
HERPLLVRVEFGKKVDIAVWTDPAGSGGAEQFQSADLPLPAQSLQIALGYVPVADFHAAMPPFLDTLGSGPSRRQGSRTPVVEYQDLLAADLGVTNTATEVAVWKFYHEVVPGKQVSPDCMALGDKKPVRLSSSTRTRDVPRICNGPQPRRERPMLAEWVIDIRDQCIAAGVSFFFKQWGGVRKKTAGRQLEGRTWDEMPRKTQPQIFSTSCKG